MTHAQMNEERIIGWVGEFAHGFGIAPSPLASLLTDVRDAVERATSNGTSYDRVNVVREPETIEFRLLGIGGDDCFVVHS